MSNLVRAGYMGIANLGGTQVRCTSFSVNPNQDVLFYNHVIGLKDTIPSNSATKGENLSAVNIQRKIWRPSPISIAGGISFPVTQNSLKYVFDTARQGNYFDLDFAYYCGSNTNARTFNDCRVNGFDLSAQAGDIVNVNMDVVAKNVTEKSTYAWFRTPQKLITWDKVQVQVSNAPFAVNSQMINGFSFKINNNVQTIYTAGTTTTDASLLPYDLRIGMQEVSGSLRVYLDAGRELIPINLSKEAKISVKMPSLSFIMTVVFKSNQIEGLVGPVITELPFVGVDYSFT